MLEVRLHADPAQTQSQTSRLLSIHEFVTIISGPFIGAFVDKTANQKIPLLVSLTVCVAGTLLVALTPTCTLEPSSSLAPGPSANHEPSSLGTLPRPTSATSEQRAHFTSSISRFWDHHLGCQIWGPSSHLPRPSPGTPRFLATTTRAGRPAFTSQSPSTTLAT